jgi:hypothetical protein
MSALGGILVCENGHLFKSFPHGCYLDTDFEEAVQKGCPCGSKKSRFIPENLLEKVIFKGTKKFITEIELLIVDLSELDVYLSELGDIFSSPDKYAIFSVFEE